MSTADFYTLAFPVFCSRQKIPRFSSQNSQFQEIFACMLLINSIFLWLSCRLYCARLFLRYISSYWQKLPFSFVSLKFIRSVFSVKLMRSFQEALQGSPIPCAELGLWLLGLSYLKISKFWWGRWQGKDHPLPSVFLSGQGNLFILKSDEILIICNVADYKLQPSSQWVSDLIQHLRKSSLSEHCLYYFLVYCR